jgi:hypothetical protein
MFAEIACSEIEGFFTEGSNGRAEDAIEAQERKASERRVKFTKAAQSVLRPSLWK